MVLTFTIGTLFQSSNGFPKSSSKALFDSQTVPMLMGSAPLITLLLSMSSNAYYFLTVRVHRTSLFVINILFEKCYKSSVQHTEGII